MTTNTMPLIAKSLRRKILVTLAVSASFVVLYQASINDSRSARESAVHDPTTSGPMAGSRLQFTATAYCSGTKTASGVNVRNGIAAADPTLLPVGSIVSVVTRASKYDGVYTILDTGAEIKGRDLDLYIPSCEDAVVFGRKDALVTVLRLGWNPRASTPGLIGRLFQRREFDRANKGTPLPVAAPEQPVVEPQAPAPLPDGTPAQPAPTDAPPATAPQAPATAPPTAE
ncbi:MAG: 3D domain-containing protein [Vicinamibacterales bacterium]